METFLVVAPVFVHLDVGLEEDALLEELLEGFAGLGADFLEGHALVADDDAFLAVALHEDDGADADALVRLVEGFHHYLAGVGYLLIVVEEYLLADDFGDEEAGGLVGPLVFVEVGRGRGQEFLDAAHDVINVEACLGGDGEYLGRGQGFVPRGDEVFKRLLVGYVDFVDEQEYGHLHAGYLLEKVLVLVGLLHHVGDVEEHVGVLEGALGEGEHLFLKLVVGLEHAGGVAEDYLCVGFVDDAHDAVARGLGLEGGDADALAHEEVHERGFSHVGVSHDVDEARAVDGLLSVICCLLSVVCCHLFFTVCLLSVVITKHNATIYD